MNNSVRLLLWFSIPLAPVLVNAQAAPATPNASPVHEHSMTSSGEHSMTVSVLADGKTHPELIPDDLAYRHFIAYLSEPRVPSPDESRRRESRLKLLNLTDADHDALIGALAGVKEDLDAANKRRDSVDGQAAVTPSKLLSIREQEKELLDQAASRVRSALSPQGLMQFETYLS